MQHTSRIIGPLLRWLNPNITDQTIHDIQAFIRKSGHVSEYAVLAVLLWRARRQFGSIGGESNWKEFGYILVVCALYASSDEIHQIFVPSRGASPVDVLIDTGGACAGLFLLWSFRRWRNRGVHLPSTRDPSRSMA